jgi:hypothetical protein
VQTEVHPLSEQGLDLGTGAGADLAQAGSTGPITMDFWLCRST